MMRTHPPVIVLMDPTINIDLRLIRILEYPEVIVGCASCVSFSSHHVNIG